MKRFLLSIGLAAMIGNTLATPIGEATFVSAIGSSIVVSMDGKEINREPRHKVNTARRAGKHQVIITVFDRKGRLQMTHRDEIIIRPGFNQQFTLKRNRSRSLSLINTRTEQLYKNYYRKPERLYNQQHYTFMSPGEIGKLKRDLMLASCENERLVIAKARLNARRVAMEDVKWLIEAFGFESSKLEFAKFAAIRAVNKDRLNILHSEFIYTTSIFELQHYFAYI